MRPANDEMILGYTDGLDLNSPTPSSNRSHSYQHGFKAGRADRGIPWNKTFDEVTAMADQAMAKDEAAY